MYEYLQIDLGELKVITMAETQGRGGGGQVYMYYIYCNNARATDFAVVFALL